MIIFPLYLLSVFITDAVFGDPHSAYHPVALFGKAAGGVEKFCRKYLGNGIFSGFAGWLILTLPVSFFAWLSVSMLLRLNFYAGFAFAVLIGWSTVALKSLTDHARKIRIPLEKGDLPAARHALSMIVSRETKDLPLSQIVRGGIESVGENLIDAVTSPFFWMLPGWLFGGLPGAAACAVFLRTVNTLDACWGYKTERYLLFGRIAARADDLIHFIPARLTLPAIAAAAALTGGSALEAFRKAIRHRHDHPSPNSGYGMASFAGALRIQLGGPTNYGGEIENYPVWGDGRAELLPHDLKRAERLAKVSALLFLLMIAGIGYLVQHFIKGEA